MAWPQDAYIGQKVICINDEHTNLVKKGNVYIIKSIFDVYIEPDHFEMPLSGNFPPPHGMFISRFRPVQPISTGFALLTALLNPANHRHREDA